MQLTVRELEQDHGLGAEVLDLADGRLTPAAADQDVLGADADRPGVGRGAAIGPKASTGNRLIGGEPSRRATSRLTGAW